MDKQLFRPYNVSIILIFLYHVMKKALAFYEIIYLLKPNYTNQEIADKIKHYQTFLLQKGSRVVIQPRGKRILNYPIQGFESAIYVQMIYQGNGELVKALNKEIKRDEGILRNLTLGLKNKVPFAEV